MAFDLNAYAARIRLERAQNGEDGLRALHLAHALAIPFENCDVRLGRRIRLDDAGLFDKLVSRGRGGYCFEQNSLLLAALLALGIRARLCLARVMLGPVPSGRTHALVLAELRGREWLCDVGFGGTTPRTPLPVDLGREDVQLGAAYRLSEGEWGTLLERRGSVGWAPEYAFTRERVLPEDLELGNHYCSTHPASHFVQRLACARLTSEGRVTLDGRVLTRHAGGVIEQRELRPDELLQALTGDLQIRADEGFAKLVEKF